jgi:uncharacterized protein (TIGR00725 family)
MIHKKIIAVIGARDCADKIWQTAEKLGKLLAQDGYHIICGGMGGVMEAVCKGARAYNGLTIGILPGDDPSQANPFVDIRIPTGMGIGRNLIIIRSAAAVVAIDGGYGTLSEIAFALQLNKPVIGLGTWTVSEKITMVESAEEAVHKISEYLDNP